MVQRRGLLAVVALALCSAGRVSAQLSADVNRANRAQLEQLRGIGPPLAERILAEREKGPFRDWADLIARVAGIRDATARRLSQAGLTVDGAPYAPPLPR